MPNREARRHGDRKALGRWLHIEDADGNPYDIYLKDISGKDEWDFMQMVDDRVGLCDLFLSGKVTLVGIAGLIWTARRRYEKKLTVLDVVKTVNMACIETMELHDPDDEDDEATPPDPTGGQPVSAERSAPPSPDSAPSTA